MKNVEMSDEAYALLQKLAAAKHLAPADILDGLLGAGHPVCGEHLLFYLTSADLLKQPDPADRYLALLAWVARHHTDDFSDFVSHRASARRYLKLSPAAIIAVHQQRPTRQIAGTQYWAVMNIDPATKSRFVRRLLEFIGCHDETVAEALRRLELPPVETPRSLRLLSVA